MKFIRFIAFILLLSITYFILLSTSTNKVSNYPHQDEIDLWENQLNELNFLIIRISATNLINGLNLTPAQINQLLVLQNEIDALNIAPILSSKDLLPEITKIRTTYTSLLNQLISKQKLTEDFKKQVFEVRLEHSLLIKKTLHGKTKVNKTKLECIQCHALPCDFPKEDIRYKKNKKVYAWIRKKIDKTHAIGLLGNEGNLKIWYSKEKVDNILTNSQKSIASSFSCCLLPPDELSDPMRAGQAFSVDQWIKYLKEIRQYDKKTWRNYKHLYIKPLEDIIVAVLPSITENNKQIALMRMEAILEDVRKMDDVTFELQKEAICKRFESCYNFNDITGVTKRSKKIEQYVTCMFLLFPGNSEVYHQLLKNQ